jgi:feruloyl esterase
MLYSNPEWDFHTFNADRDTQAADEKLAKVLNATDPDLSAFQKRGGKLLMYHGWSDAAIPAANAVEYFDAVNKKMGAVTQTFMRLYMVPGMGHCTGGSGASSFGQLSTPDGDRFHSLDAALEAWVENGNAPEQIIASKYKAPDRKVVEKTHPLCPWPQVAVYKGTGSVDDAASFACGIQK